MSDPFRVVAIIAAFNEGDIISPVIGHLVNNGVEVYLMDNHSTDDTVEQAEQWLGRGLLKIETFPCDNSSDTGGRGLFDWTAILRRKEQLANDLHADWLIHHDADEVRESPWPGLTLKDAIQWVDERGYNCVDFRVFNFPPLDNGFKQGDDPRSYFTFYEDVGEFDKLQLKCWKAGKKPVSLVPSGGHDASFDGRRIFPIPFILRHYPIRGQVHGVKKVFAERKSRLINREHEQGWHIQYDHIQNQAHTFLKNPRELLPFDLDEIRLDLMQRDSVLSNLAERLAGADVEVIALRSQQKQIERGLGEYKAHATGLEQVREEQRLKITDLEQQVMGLEHGLEEYKSHANNLENARAELLRRIEEVERERDVTNETVVGLEGLRDALQSSNRTLQQQMSAVCNSRSWRWTAPLRYLFDRLTKSSGS